MNDTVTNTVNVNSPPTVTFSIDPQVLTTRTNADFVYTGTSASVFQWDFGDGTTSTGSETEHLYGEDGFYTISLVATDDNGCVDSTSQTVEVLIQPVIYMPNAFAPNGTPDNARFKGYGIGVASAELTIFDRWGTILFYSDDMNEILTTGWDGTYKGEAAQQGAYAYKLKASFYTGSSFERLGTVTLIR
jgi:gliding motility-associated-like protein